MSNRVDNILIIDDESHVFLKRKLSAIYPDAKVSAFPELKKALRFLNSCSPENRPNLIINDCSEGSWALGELGLENGKAIIKWYKKKTGAMPNATMVFISQDLQTAQKVSSRFKQEIDLNSFATETNEFRQYVSAARGEQYRFSKPDTENGFREFLNHTAGLTLPITQADLDRELLRNGNLNPDEVMRLTQKNKIEPTEALRLIGSEIRKALKEDYNLRVDIDKTPEGIFPDDTKINFEEAIGNPVTGYAAYTIDDIKRNASNKKKSILITEKYTPDFIPYLKDIIGIVMLSNEGTGHLKMLLSSHNISGLFDGTRNAEDRGFGDKPNTVCFEEYLRVLHEISYGSDYQSIKRRLARQKELYPNMDDDNFDYETIDRELVRNIYTNITGGHPVTLNIGQYEKSFYGCALQITDKNYKRHDWLTGARRLLTEWKKANGIGSPVFKANIDSVEQFETAVQLAEGIGLVRTEHLVLTSVEQMAAYKNAILNQDEESFEVLTKLQAEDFQEILKPLSHSFPVKIRLLDAPPSEFFTAEEQKIFGAIYGDENLRGVQLAWKISKLYESQIRAIFHGLKAARGSRFEHGEDMNDKSPVEILVPTIRTAEELDLVWHLVKEVAGQEDINEEDYRFGSMLETLDACSNIQKIAEACDFISIGSNDLTSEILECHRDDWEKRRLLTVQSGTGADPFLKIHEKVLSVIFEAVALARDVKPDIAVDLCGEHASDEESLSVLHDLNLSGLSMRPTAQNMLSLRMLNDYNLFEKHKAAQPS